MKQFKKKEFAIIPTKVKMATKATVAVKPNMTNFLLDASILPLRRLWPFRNSILTTRVLWQLYVMPSHFSAYSVEVLLPMLAIRRILTHTAIVLAYC